MSPAWVVRSQQHGVSARPTPREVAYTAEQKFVSKNSEASGSGFPCRGSRPSMDLLRTSILLKRAQSRFLALRERWPLYSRAITAERISILEFEPRDQFEQRQKKLEQIQALGFDPFPREFRWTDTPASLVDKLSATPGPELEANKREVRASPGVWFLTGRWEKQASRTCRAPGSVSRSM